MNPEIKKTIDSSATRALVSDILKDVYKDDEKKYAIACVEVRFTSIAESLTKAATMEKELTELKAAGSSDNNSAYTEALEQIETISGMLKEKEEELKTKQAFISELEESLRIKNEEIEEAEKQFQQLNIDFEELKQCHLIEVNRNVNIRNVDTESTAFKAPQQPLGSSTFFQDLFTLFNDNLGLKMLINKENDMALITVIPEPKINDTDFINGLPPIFFHGTPSEIDSELIKLLSGTINVVAKVTTEIAAYEKAVAEAKATAAISKKDDKVDSKAKPKGKGKVDPAQKSVFDEQDSDDIEEEIEHEAIAESPSPLTEEESLVELLSGLEAALNWAEALPIAYELLQLNSAKYQPRYNNVKAEINKQSTTLF